MLTIFFALLAGSLGGILAAGFVSWRRFERRYGRAPLDHRAIDPDVDRQINEAAAQWATARHRPGVAPLVANKLRLAYALSLRQARRPQRRWWRW